MDAAAELGRNPVISTKFSLSMEINRLTRDRTAEPVSRDQYSGANGDREILIFPVQLTPRRIGNLTRLILTLAIRDDHTHIHTPVLSTCPLHTNSGCGKREAHINWSMVTCQGSTRYWNCLEVHWPCAGGLSAVNGIGTQLRDPITSGLTRWRMAV